MKYVYEHKDDAPTMEDLAKRLGIDAELTGMPTSRRKDNKIQFDFPGVPNARLTPERKAMLDKFARRLMKKVEP